MPAAPVSRPGWASSRPGCQPVSTRPSQLSDAAILAHLGGEVAAGRIRVPIHATYPLADVPAAFGNFAAGKTGKIAIAID
jgi:NADPH:quinone reductase-like Zn-dependent oxidoreductase